MFNLQDLRNAVIWYVDNKVTVTISAITPAQGTSLGPNEDFSFTLTAKNADASVGGVPLKNVVWYVSVQNDVIAKLYVPAAPMTARAGLSPTLPALAAGTQVREMYLFPPLKLLPGPFPIDSANYLGVGDTDSIALRGKAGGSAAGGSTNIQFKVLGDMDMDWLFPPNQDSALALRTVSVIG